MVYHGRPSSGCACCKRRRKKCDETHPQCRNCQKIGVECPGFPDKLDIMFKDETPVLMQRARKSPKRSPGPSHSPPQQSGEPTAAPSVTRTLSSSGSSDNAWSVITSELSKGAVRSKSDRSSQSSKPTFRPTGGIPPPLIGYSPTLPIPQSDSPVTEELTRRFLSHFEQSSDQYISTPGLVAIIKPWLEIVPLESALRLIVQAIAVRTMANHYQRPDLIGSANALYYQAMATVQISIVETSTCIYDDTLLTILLFTAYEALGATSINNWSDHVRGAYSVLESRAPQRVDSPTSLMLFRATRANVLADSLRRWEPMPELSGSDGWLEGEPHSAGGHIFDHFVELTCLLARTKELWASTSRDQESLLEAENMIERAIKLQEVFADPQACTQRNCHCMSVVEFENADKPTTIHDQALRPSESEQYPRYSVQTSPSRHYCHIGQLYCSRLIARLSAWIEPLQYADNERFQSASLWTKHLHEVVQASVPSYLTQLDKAGPKEYGNINGGPGQPISISGLAQGLHMPPLHWVLVSANAKG